MIEFSYYQEYEGVDGKLVIFRNIDQSRKHLYDISVYTTIYFQIDNIWCTPGNITRLTQIPEKIEYQIRKS